MLKNYFRRWRRGLVGLAMLAAAGGLGRGQEGAAAAELAATLRELEALPPELREALPEDVREALATWDAPQRRWWWNGELGVAAGWRENVGLRTSGADGTAMARTRAESMGWRPAESGAAWEWLALVDAEYRRYFDAGEAEAEYTWLAHGEGRWFPAVGRGATLAISVYGAEEVLDLSVGNVGRVIERLRLSGGLGELSGAWRLGRGWSVRAGGAAQAVRYADFDEDFDEARGRVRVEWEGAARAWVEAGETRRDYADRVEFTAAGRPFLGTRLRFEQRQAELGVRWRWERASGRWTLGGETGWRDNRDGASGYFDYEEEFGALRVEWRREAWAVEAEARGRRLTYLVQTVGEGIAPEARRQDETTWRGRVGREIGGAWEAWIEAEGLRHRTNEAGASYRDLMLLAGMARRF